MARVKRDDSYKMLTWTGWLRSPGMRNSCMQWVTGAPFSRLVHKEFGFWNVSSNPQCLAPPPLPQEPCLVWEQALAQRLWMTFQTRVGEWTVHLWLQIYSLHGGQRGSSMDFWATSNWSIGQNGQDTEASSSLHYVCRNFLISKHYFWKKYYYPQVLIII